MTRKGEKPGQSSLLDWLVVRSNVFHLKGTNGVFTATLNNASCGLHLEVHGEPMEGQFATWADLDCAVRKLIVGDLNKSRSER